MPWPYVMSRLLGLLSLAILATGLWFVIEWVQTDLRSNIWLLVGSVLLATALFGRVLVLMGLKPGKPAPLPQPDCRETIVGSGGCPIYVEGFGARGRDAVVLTCGWGFDRSLWSGIVERLRGDYHVLVWDPPGVGRSGQPFDGLYTVERFGDDLRAVLALTDGRPPLLVGHGLGALTVLEFCRAGRHKGVAGVALLNGAAASPLDYDGEAWLMHRLRWFVLEPLLRLDMWLSPLVQAASWASYLNGTAQLAARSAAFGADPTRYAVDRTAFVASGQSPSVQAKALSAALARGGSETAAMLRAPLLVIAGEYDALVDEDACRRTAEEAPEGKLLVVEDAGHAGPMELPGAYAEAIAELARMAFERCAARRARAAAVRDRARQFAAAPEPRSWIARPESEDLGGDADEEGEGEGWAGAP